MHGRLVKLFKRRVRMEPSSLIHCLLCTGPARQQTLKTLPDCQHIFCADCLLKYCRVWRKCTAATVEDETAQLGQYEFQCPTCTTKCSGHNLRSEVPVNHDVYRLCENVALRCWTESGDERCQQCAANGRRPRKPIFKCLRCDVAVCGSCCADHRSSRHRLLKWSQLKRGVHYRCTLHDRTITHHCADCRRMICDACTTGTSSTSHSDHRLQALDELRDAQRKHFQKKQEEIRQLIQEKSTQKKLCLQLQEREEKNYRRVAQHIRREMERLVDSVKKNGNQLLKQLDEIHQRLKTLSTNHVTYLDYGTYVLNDIHFFLEQLMLPGKEPVALLHQNDIDQYLTSEKSDVVKNRERTAIRNMHGLPSFDSDVRYSNANGITLGALSMTEQVTDAVDVMPTFSPEHVFLIPDGQMVWQDTAPACSRRPHGLLFVSAKQNSLLVAERSAGQITKYDQDGNRLPEAITTKNFAPRNMALDENRRLLYVTDERQGTVRAFDGSGAVIQTGIERRKFDSPSGIATNGEHVVVSDVMALSVTVLRTDGEQVTKIKKDSSGGTFRHPTFLTIDDRKRIVVSDSLSNRISVFDLSGRHLFSFGSKGNGDGELQSPNGICQDHFGNYLVVDTDNHRICRFKEDGSFDKTVIQFSVGSIKPHGIALSASGQVAITDLTTDSIAVYRLYNL